MDQILGPGNTLLDYLLILLTYGGLFIAVSPRMDASFRRSFWVLFVVWGFGIFIGNYVFYLLGIMSFLHWPNNFIHSFIWIGICLGFMYASSYKQPLWKQLVTFAIFSFVVKVTENRVLGTWDLNHFFFIPSNIAYIIGWSLFDALYPIGSAITLMIASRFIQGLVVPKLNLTQST